ncbi:MAG: hypothetical protein ACE5RC_00095 [Nitrosopumilus sp.]
MEREDMDEIQYSLETLSNIQKKTHDQIIRDYEESVEMLYRSAKRFVDHFDAKHHSLYNIDSTEDAKDDLKKIINTLEKNDLFEKDED